MAGGTLVPCLGIDQQRFIPEVIDRAEILDLRHRNGKRLAERQVVVRRIQIVVVTPIFHRHRDLGGPILIGQRRKEHQPLAIGRTVFHRWVRDQTGLITDGSHSQVLRFPSTGVDAGQFDRLLGRIFVNDHVADRVQQRRVINRIDRDRKRLSGRQVVTRRIQIVIVTAVLDGDRDHGRAKLVGRRGEPQGPIGIGRTVIDRRCGHQCVVTAAGRYTQVLRFAASGCNASQADRLFGRIFIDRQIVDCVERRRLAIGTALVKVDLGKKNPSRGVSFKFVVSLIKIGTHIGYSLNLIKCDVIGHRDQSGYFLCGVELAVDDVRSGGKSHPSVKTEKDLN